YITILKLLVATLGISRLLKEMNICKSSRWIPSLMYGFSGWTFLFMEHPMYITWFALLPLIFLAIEKFIQSKKVSLVIVSSFLLLISNYYLFWSLCIFLIFYWPLRYFMVHSFDLKQFFFWSLKLVGGFILGCFMALILILPAALHTIQNTRLATDQESLTLLWNPIKIYLDLVMRALTPNFDATWDKPLLFNTDDYRTNQLTIYSGVVAFTCLFTFFFNVKRYKMKETWLWLSLYLVMGSLLLSPYGGSLMHGLSEPTFRWTILIILINTILVGKLLNEKDQSNKLILTSSILVFIALLLLCVIGFVSYEYLFELQIAEIKMMIFTAILVGVYAFIFILIKNNRLKLLAIGSLLVLELILSSTKTLHRFPEESSTFALGEKYSTDAFDYLETIDSSFYRVFTPIAPKDYSTYRNLNLHYGYRGVSTYDSMYQFSLGDFIELIGANPNYWGFHILESDLHQMLGVNYYLIKHGEEALVPNLSELTLVKTFENESLYQLNNSLPIGYSFTNFISLSEAKHLNRADIDFLNTLILNDESISSINYQTQLASKSSRDLFMLSDFSNNKLNGSIEMTTPGYLFLSIPFDTGWKVTVNGQPTAIESVQGGFIGIPLEMGTYDISLTYTPPGLMIGSIISLIALLAFIPIVMIENRKKLI
ncbi:MAG: YfhO family protein, partial [Turicibacter sp.]